MPRSRLKKAGPSEERFIKAIIMGPPGHGKTHLLGTAVFDERTKPIAILDFEGGVLDVLTGLPGEGTDWIRMPVGTWQDFNEAYERIRVNEEGFKAVAIDSLSETHVFAIMTILDEEGGRRQDPDLVQQQDYGKAMVQMRRLTRVFRDLPMHVFYTAHSKDEVDPKEGLVKMVNLSGKLATEIPGMMTVCGYLALTEDDEGHVQRVLLLQNYAKIRTKVRTPWNVVAPDEIVDPSITTLLDALQY